MSSKIGTRAVNGLKSTIVADLITTAASTARASFIRENGREPDETEASLLADMCLRQIRLALAMRGRAEP
jgi:hypothetical protein